MKNIRQISSTIILVMALAIVSTAVKAAQYYVVIASFSEESNAQKFTINMRDLFKNISYRYNQERDQYYVHVMETSRKDEARNWSLYLKHEKGLEDVWVFTDGEAEENSVSKGNVAQGNKEPRYTADVNLIAGNSPFGIPGKESGKMPYEHYKNRESSVVQWTSAGNDVSYISDIKNISDIKGSIGNASGKLFTFIVEDSEGKSLSSEVLLVNFEKAKKIASFKAGEHVAMRGTRQNQMVTLVCDELGYAMDTRVFNLDHISRAKGIVQNKDGVWEVRFKLKKMSVHDVSFMHQTVFYEDAAVLQPTSEEEANELLALMKANPGYKIMIHSHCNSDSKRAIKLPAGFRNYFGIEGSIERSGTDKKLTKERARILRDYLIQKGVDKDRVSAMGWGSSDMLVQSTALDAYINDRIEIELLDNGEN